MNLETVIAQKVHALPPVKQAEVLAFVETLEREKKVVEPEQSAEQTLEDPGKEAGRLSIIGLFSSGKTDTSSRVDEILAQGINKREGWSLP